MRTQDANELRFEKRTITETSYIHRREAAKAARSSKSPRKSKIPTALDSDKVWSVNPLKLVKAILKVLLWDAYLNLNA